jgi:hypothetical protein
MCWVKGSQANAINHPINTYNAVDVNKNFFTKKDLKTVPPIASPHTTPKIVQHNQPLTTKNRNGVYVPAIKK